MKRKVIAALLLSMSLLAAGCSGGQTAQTETKATEANTETTATEAKTEAKTEAESKQDATEAESKTEAESETEAAVKPEYKAAEYVTLGEYKGLEVTLQKVEVADSEIESAIQSAISQNDKMEEIKDGVVADGDVINLDYAGTLDGEAFDNGTQKGADLTIGSNTFIDGFESGMIGMKVGETKKLNITMPEDYQAEELAGEEVVFEVTVNTIKRAPELTDALTAEISDYKTVDEYKESLKKQLLEEKESSQFNKEINDLLQTVYSNSKINDYPKDVVTYQLDQMKTYYQSYADQSEQTLEEFVQQNFQLDLDDFNTRLEDNVKQGMIQEMLLKAIAEKENLTISDEEYQTGAEKFAKKFNLETVEELEKQYSKSVIESSLIQDKVINLLVENAKVTNPEDKVETSTEAESDSEKATEKTSEKATEKTSEKTSEKISENTSEKESETKAN